MPQPKQPTSAFACVQCGAPSTESPPETPCSECGGGVFVANDVKDTHPMKDQHPAGGNDA